MRLSSVNNSDSPCSYNRVYDGLKKRLNEQVTLAVTLYTGIQDAPDSNFGGVTNSPE
jgi:hypothetical protein